MLLTKMRVINWATRVLENPENTKYQNPQKIELALWRLKIAQERTRIQIAKICFPDSDEERSSESETPPSDVQGIVAYQGDLYLSGYINN